MTVPTRLRWLWLTLFVVFVDRATKFWFEFNTSGHWPKELVHNYIYLVQSRNPGIGFGFFSDSTSNLTRMILILGSLIMVAVLARMLLSSRNAGACAEAGIALLLGGAAGNLTDRLLHGAVTDFLEVWLRFIPLRIFNPWPAFNVADSAIAIGAILILFEVLFPSRVQSRQSVKS